ncbi:MAG: DUF3846 domain-containing protein [Ruminococcus sp.]|nr:DUF3846 domain-containing protein [Ruminococcus sp.]
MCLTKDNCEQHTDPQNYKGKLLILKPQVLEPQFRQKEAQYFFAETGFGCDPNSLGTAVFGHFLANGQKARLDRSSFIGIADKNQLPIWAANRLELLEKPSMKIRVFQLKDASPLTFMNFDETVKKGGVKDKDYRQVYGGTVFAKDLEDVFRICNTDLPYGYHGHSLSVSDVVQVCEGENKGFYYVDPIGWQKLDDFDISLTDHNDMMKVLILEKDRLPYEAEIKHNIYAMQHIVGGSFDIIYFEPKDDAICFCNDEFLLNGSQPNRVVGNTLVHGTCFITGNGMNEYGEYDSCSLTDEQIRKYSEMFPQSVIMTADLAVPTQDETQEETIEQTLT